MQKSLVNKCQSKLSSVKFVNSADFYWSPKTSTIHYNNAVLETEAGQWALLHETAHALLGHQTYQTDVRLLQLEVEAWQSAKSLGQEFKIHIDPEHVQDCLDTYRDWLYARSTCPTCQVNSLQTEETVYVCVNCSTRWVVSRSRFCRPYRMQSRDKKTPPEVNQTVFA